MQGVRTRNSLWIDQAVPAQKPERETLDIILWLLIVLGFTASFLLAVSLVLGSAWLVIWVLREIARLLSNA
jgi:hypothetical protein